MVRVTIQVSDGNLMQLDEVEIRTGQKIFIGKTHADIKIKDRRVSDPHLVLMIENGKLVVHDLGSKTGTYCEGRKISTKPIFKNDVLEIGSHYIRFVSCTWE